MELKKLTIENIGGGAIGELFDRELERVLKNLDDPNADATKERKITFEFGFKATPGREFMDIQVKVNSKLVPVKPLAWAAHLVRDGKDLQAFAPKGLQKEIFDMDNVTDMAEAAEQGRKK